VPTFIPGSGEFPINTANNRDRKDNQLPVQNLLASGVLREPLRPSSFNRLRMIQENRGRRPDLVLYEFEEGRKGQEEGDQTEPKAYLTNQHRTIRKKQV
jgi:hypothetical protein